MQLCPWTYYTPVGALGGFILIDALPNTRRHQRLLAVVMGCILWTICVTVPPLSRGLNLGLAALLWLCLCLSHRSHELGRN